MNFVFVGDTPNKLLIATDFRLRAVQLSGNALISLINGLKQQNFGYDTVGKLFQELNQYKKFIHTEANAELFIDSGGYSIINGDIAPNDVNMVIDCYNQVLKSCADVCDYIFSLDIPFSIKYEEINSIDFIEQANRKSLADSISILNADPLLWDRFYFVWHFKMLKQYRVWDKLYTELNLQSQTSNYAIGGLVGLRKHVDINRCPFTAMAFRCFLDFYESNITDKPLRLHFLGVNLPQDRLLIAILESLFNRIQDRFEVLCTYDSINYAHIALKSPTEVRWTTLENSTLNSGSVLDTPESIINSVYPDDSMRSPFNEEVDNMRNGQRMKDSNAFVPLSVATNLRIDRYLEELAEQFVTEILSSSTHSVFQRDIKNILTPHKQNNEKQFSKNFFNETMNNLGLLFELNLWWQKGANRRQLNQYILDQINEISFPDDLH